jgi:hypothetical protein
MRAMIHFSDALVEQIARGSCTLVLGSGLSEAAGLPGRATLMAKLAAELGAPASLPPLEIAQLYQTKLGRQAVLQKVIEALDISSVDVTCFPYLARLVQLPIQTWITTNYDQLLEAALQRARRRFQRVVRDQDLPYINADQLTLVKIHGDIGQPDSLIVTNEDFNTYFRRYPLVKSQLSYLLVQTTLFFIGFDANDPAFRQLRDEICFDLKEHHRRAYALLPTADEWTIESLNAQQIDTLTLDTDYRAPDFGPRLSAALDVLLQQIKDKRPVVEAISEAPIAPFQDIADLLKRGKVIPVLGPSMAASRSLADSEWYPGATYLPKQDELAHYLALRGNFPKLEPIDLAKVAQYYVDGVSGRVSLNNTLHRVFGRDYPVGLAHHFLAEIDAPLLIVTTYYDDLIERAFQAAHKPFDLVVHLSDDQEYAGSVLWWPHDGEPRPVPPNELHIDLKQHTVIYKTHGTIDRSDQDRDAYFITEDDQVELLARTPEGIPAIFAEPFRNRSFLYLGYGLDYWPMRVVFSKLRRKWPQRQGVVSWAVQRNPSPLEREFWAKRGVNLYELPLDEFVEKLRACM